MTMSLSRAAWRAVAPFAAFMALLALRGAVPADGSWGFDPRWLYALAGAGRRRTAGVWWREYGELARQTLPDAREVLLAVAVGVAVFALWIQLDAPWMTHRRTRRRLRAARRRRAASTGH